MRAATVRRAITNSLAISLRPFFRTSSCSGNLNRGGDAALPCCCGRPRSTHSTSSAFTPSATCTSQLFRRVQLACSQLEPMHPAPDKKRPPFLSCRGFFPLASTLNVDLQLAAERESLYSPVTSHLPTHFTCPNRDSEATMFHLEHFVAGCGTWPRETPCSIWNIS